MFVQMVGNRVAHSTTAKRFGRILCHVSKSHRNGHCVKTASNSETKIPQPHFKRSQLRYFALTGVIVPWLHSKSCLASELFQTTMNEGVVVEMEAEALDVGAVLLGDVALLVMAPLVIYAALKMIWEEQFEDPNTETKKIEEFSPSMHLSKGDSPPSSSLDSSDLKQKLVDPFLQDLAARAAENISKAVKEANESCLFDADLHELVIKSEGENANQKWIYDMLSKQEMISKSEMERLNVELKEKSKKLSDEEICLLMSQIIAEKAALKELQRLTTEIMERY